MLGKEITPYTNTSSIDVIVDRLREDIGFKFAVEPGRIFERIGDGDTSHYATDTIDVKKLGHRNSKRKLLGAQTVIRFVGQTKSVAVAGILDLSLVGQIADPIIMAKVEKNFPQEVRGYIVSEANERKLPAGLFEALKTMGLTGYRSLYNFRHNMPLPRYNK